MPELRAQISSGLLRFPAVTVQALGEDEVTLDSVLRGRFTAGRSTLAWMACGPHLEVVHAATGERFSAYCFSGVTDHQQPTVTAVREFSWLKRSGLLVALQEDDCSMLCLYDLGISRVIKAVVIPNRITAIEPLVSYGGASAHTQHLHQSLRWFFGVVAVVTDVGRVLLVDLCLDDFSCTQTELEASDLEVVNKAPGDIPRLREGVTQQGRHLCLQLCSPTGTGATAMTFISRTNQLAVGFSDGILQLWNMKSLKREYHHQLEGGRVPVYCFTFQEPENDPRNCCYLWAVQSAQDLEGDVLSLHLLQLAFGERKTFASGKIIYEGLEYCEERYSQDLCAGMFPLRAQATNTRLLSCQSIEKFRHHPDREESVNEVTSPDTSVALFSWQVKSYGQGQPSTYISIFDINRWYHAQMPDCLRTGESLRNCPYLAVWSLDCVVEVAQACPLLDVVVQERSLSRALPHSCPPPEQFYNPNTFNFDGSCLLSAGVVHFTCSGYQKETLSYLKEAVLSLSDGISNGYSQCLMSGLLSPRLADVQPSSLSEQEQLDAVLSTAVETSALGLITGCIKQWSTEEPLGSAGNLRYILQWAWDKVVKTKEELDSICAPLFDSSSNFTDPQTLQLLQHSQRSLSNLSTIFHCLLNQAQELTHQGVMGLMNKCMVSSLISQYAQVVLWFCRTGLLPESVDEDVLQISRPFYSFSIIKNYYTGQREELQRLAEGKWNADCLMIDGLVAQCGERLLDLWKRDEGGTGQYPPPSLHALLDLYLLEDVDESTKHAIVIYLLLDVMYSFPNKSGSSVESFPTAFSIPIGLVKLVQGLWLLDHHDHENSLDLLLHPSVSPCVRAWQHSRVLQALMIQNKHSTALQYLHTMRPSVSSTHHIQLCLSVLLHNRCMVEAWAMLRQHINKFSMEELLMFFYKTCQDLGLMKDLLALPLRASEHESLERFLQGTGGFQNRELLMVHHLQQANYIPALQINQSLKQNLAADRNPKLKERSNTRNSIMSQYGKVLPRAQRKLAMERSKPYQLPSTIHREVSRPQPLSTVAKRSANQTVLSRAAFIKNVLTKIEEVWVLKDATPESSPLRSPKVPEASSLSSAPLVVPDAFIGTPINMLTKRMSRLLEQAVQPSSQKALEVSCDLITLTKPISAWAAPKCANTGPELGLLQTPQVVKRARALAASSSVFSFTPQSILRSSLRPTPIATPTASPPRSATPPLRCKESRITFVEESESLLLNKSPVRRGNRLANDEGGSLKLPSYPPQGGVEAWSDQSVEEEEEEEEEEKEDRLVFMPALDSDVKRGSGRSRLVLPPLVCRPSLGHETSQLSIQSDSTLEFHDALSPADVTRHTQEEEEVIVRRAEAAESAAGSESDHEVAPQDGVSTPPQMLQYLNQEAPEIKTGQESAGEAFGTQPDLKEEPMEEQGVEQTEVQELPKDSITEFNSTTPEFIQNDSLIQEAEVPADSVRSSENSQEPIREADAYEASEQPQQPITDLIFNQPAGESLTQDSEFKSLESEQQHSPTSVEPITALPAATSSKDLRGEGHVIETSDLDVYVEQCLFGSDLSPPHDSILTETVRYQSSEGDCADKDSEVKSVSSSAASTSDSHSVVTLHDSEELSSAKSEEEEEEEEEDSGSEVEIIKEVLGTGAEQQELYLQDHSPEDQNDQFFQEQQAAVEVLSLISAGPQLQESGGEEEEEEEEEEEVQMGLQPVSVEEDGVCYAELKPSTTLLRPVELLPAGSHDFSLMLEPDDEEPVSQNHAALEPSTQLQDERADGASSEATVSRPDPGEVEQMEDLPSDDDDDDDDHAALKADLYQSEVLPELDPADSAEALPEQEVNMDLTTVCSEDLHEVAEEPLEEPAAGPGEVLAEDGLGHSTRDGAAALRMVPETVPVTKDHSSDAEKLEATGEVLEVKEPPRSPGRRGRKAVMFPLPDDHAVPSTPKRMTRSSRPLPAEVPVMPRRSSRKAEPHLQEEETVPTSRPSLSHKTPQKATPRQGSRKTRSTSGNSSEEEPEEPSTMETPSARKTRRTYAIEVPESIPEENAEEKEADGVASPGRVTRQSSRRLSLTIETLQEAPPQTLTPPRSRRRTRGATEVKANHESSAVDAAQLQNVSRRLTRSQLWNDTEEPEKSGPVELENPLMSATMERLTEAAVEPAPVTEIVHARRRTRSTAPSAGAYTQEVELTDKTANESAVDAGRRTTRATVPPENSELQDPGSAEATDHKNKAAGSTKKTRTSKVPEPASSPPVITSSLPRSKGRRKGVSITDVPPPPLTRTRRTASVPDQLQDEVPENNDITTKQDQSKKRSNRARVVPEPVQVDLLSPLASPAETKAREQREDKDVFAPQMNLRRKRLMEAIFPKPVTRRRKL